MVKFDPLALFLSFSRQWLIWDALFLLSAMTDPIIFFLLLAMTDPRVFFFLSAMTDLRVLFLLSARVDPRGFSYCSRLVLVWEALLLALAMTDLRVLFFLSARTDPRGFFLLLARTDPRSFSYKRSDINGFPVTPMLKLALFFYSENTYSQNLGNFSLLL